MASNNIVRFDPFEDLGRLQREMNRLFEDTQTPRWARTNGIAQGVWAPQVDIHEDGNAITVKVDLPGVKQEDIDIQLTNDSLTITGERKFEDEERKSNYVRVERAYGSFTRTFTLPQTVDQENVQADYDKGVLKVKLAKKAEAKPKQIKVNVGSAAGGEKTLEAKEPKSAGKAA